MSDLSLKSLDLVDAVDDILLVEVAELDLRDVIRLDLVDAKACHKVGDNVLFLLSMADDLDRLVDVQQDLSESEQKMELVLLLLEIELKLALEAGESELDPFLYYRNYAELSWCRVDQHVEIALEAVFKGSELKELEHKLVGINAAAQIERELKSAEVDLVTEVHDLLELALLNEIRDLVKYHLDRGRVGDLNYINAVLRLVVVIARADLHRARAGLVDLLHLLAIVEYRSSAWEIGCLDDIHYLVGRHVGVLEHRDRSVADLSEIERADVGCHTDRDTHIGCHEDIREGRRQKNGLLHCVIVVGYEVDRILVDALEELGTEGIELYLGVTRCGEAHIRGILLTKASLGVNEGMQKCLVTSCESHHSFIYCHIAVGVELHRLTDDVRALRAVARQKSHLVHRVKELSVRRLETVDLGDRTRDDNAHNVRHIVFLNRIGYQLLLDGSVDYFIGCLYF